MTRKERWKRRGICLFIAMGGALALLAGPAAALLMIPRQMDWPVGGGIYWLNGMRRGSLYAIHELTGSNRERRTALAYELGR